ncbi:MAG: hypothetical protein AAB468_02535 [Patescibacteria group bacterium]
MALSDKEILRQRELGNIVIDPYYPGNLSTSSYDVTLGPWYFREQLARGQPHIYNIFSQEHTARVWGKTPEQAQAAREILPATDLHDGIIATDQIILIQPGETILAHTNEFIGGRKIITTMMKARSSLGRNFIEVCKCAGWGDVGYINRWTMEITNNSRHYAIPLVVGMRIAQIIFFHTGEILKHDYAKSGKYQSAVDLKKLKKLWRPEMMVPKLYKDRQKPPA